MEAVGARLGRSSNRYGPTTVFTGPVRKWKKNWIHVAPSTASNGNSNTGSRNGSQTQAADGSNGVKSNVMLYKWTPVSEKGTSGVADVTTPVKDDDDERPKKKFKFIPIALLEEQKSEAAEQEEEETKATVVDLGTDEKVSENKIVDEKPDMNDTPMKDDEEIGTEGEQEERQDLNKTVLDLSEVLTGNDEENGSHSKTDEDQFCGSLPKISSMSAKARSFVIWLHGLGDSGTANRPIQNHFTSPEFSNTGWSFPTAPSNPVTCNNGRVMHSWFDVHKMPVTGREEWQTNRSARFTCFGKGSSSSAKDQSSGLSRAESSPEVTTGLLDSVKCVHALIDTEVANGTDPKNIFVCGLSQGGALTVASVLLYPKTLGGAAVFSGWVPSNTTLLKQVTPEAKKTPFLWCHGTDDKLILFDAGKAGERFLKEAGLNCKFKVYPGLWHTLLDDELVYLGDWIKSRLGSSS